jgi:branched-chain amino acid transport system permease protein
VKLTLRPALSTRQADRSVSPGTESEAETTATSLKGGLDRRFIVGVVVWVAALALTPTIVGSVYLGVAILVLLAIPGGIALNLLQGVAGQVSVGNAAFLGVGGYAAATFTVELHAPFLVSLLAGTVCAGAVGVVVAIPALRVRGLYLLLATLALQFIASYLFNVYQGAANQPAGFLLPNPSVGGYQITSDSQWYWVLAVVASALLYAMVRIKRSWIGRAWMAIRQDEKLAAASGVNVTASIVMCFAVTSAIIGLQGVLYAYRVGLVNSDSYSLTLAIAYVTIVLVGGEGSTAGPILGAIVVEGLPYVLNELIPAGSSLAVHSADIQQAAYGLLIVVVLIAEPEGLAGVGRRLGRRSDSMIRAVMDSARRRRAGAA